jgi:hypothetical protein
MSEPVRVLLVSGSTRAEVARVWDVLLGYLGDR